MQWLAQLEFGRNAYSEMGGLDYIPYKKVYHINCVIFSDSPCIIKYAKQLGFSVLPITKRNNFGLPILKWLLIAARDSFPSKQIIYINSDILINPFVFEMSHRLHTQFNGSNVEPSFLPHP